MKSSRSRNRFSGPLPSCGQESRAFAEANPRLMLIDNDAPLHAAQFIREREEQEARLKAIIPKKERRKLRNQQRK